jgi:hypothetical protein
MDTLRLLDVPSERWRAHAVCRELGVDGIFDRDAGDAVAACALCGVVRRTQGGARARRGRGVARHPVRAARARGEMPQRERTDDARLEKYDKGAPG